MNDHELDDIFGSDTYIGSDYLPHELGAEERKFSKRVTLMRDQYIRQMRAWRGQGETIECYIASCHESIRDEVRKIATEEGFL